MNDYIFPDVKTYSIKNEWAWQTAFSKGLTRISEIDRIFACSWRDVFMYKKGYFV